LFDFRDTPEQLSQNQTKSGHQQFRRRGALVDWGRRCMIGSSDVRALGTVPDAGHGHSDDRRGSVGGCTGLLVCVAADDLTTLCPRLGGYDSPNLGFMVT
jgi:hypothetical protein